MYEPEWSSKCRQNDTGSCARVIGPRSGPLSVLRPPTRGTGACKSVLPSDVSSTASEFQIASACACACYQTVGENLHMIEYTVDVEAGCQCVVAQDPIYDAYAGRRYATPEDAFHRAENQDANAHSADLYRYSVLPLDQASSPESLSCPHGGTKHPNAETIDTLCNETAGIGKATPVLFDPVLGIPFTWQRVGFYAGCSYAYSTEQEGTQSPSLTNAPSDQHVDPSYTSHSRVRYSDDATEQSTICACWCTTATQAARTGYASLVDVHTREHHCYCYTLQETDVLSTAASNPETEMLHRVPPSSEVASTIDVTVQYGTGFVASIDRRPVYEPSIDRDEVCQTQSNDYRYMVLSTVQSAPKPPPAPPYIPPIPRPSPPPSLPGGYFTNRPYPPMPKPPPHPTTPRPPPFWHPPPPPPHPPYPPHPPLPSPPPPVPPPPLPPEVTLEYNALDCHCFDESHRASIEQSCKVVEPPDQDFFGMQVYRRCPSPIQWVAYEASRVDDPRNYDPTTTLLSERRYEECKKWCDDLNDVGVDCRAFVHKDFTTESVNAWCTVYVVPEATNILDASSKCITCATPSRLKQHDTSMCRVRRYTREQQAAAACPSSLVGVNVQNLEYDPFTPVDFLSRPSFSSLMVQGTVSTVSSVPYIKQLVSSSYFSYAPLPSACCFDKSSSVVHELDVHAATVKECAAACEHTTRPTKTCIAFEWTLQEYKYHCTLLTLERSRYDQERIRSCTSEALGPSSSVNPSWTHETSKALDAVFKGRWYDATCYTKPQFVDPNADDHAQWNQISSNELRSRFVMQTTLYDFEHETCPDLVIGETTDVPTTQWSSMSSFTSYFE